jgi:ATP-binding cassette subfamily B protein
VCGWNGSGKTTLLNVLARLVDYEGLLLINDIDARHYEPKSLHAAISATFQDYAKMCGSVAENVGMGDFEKLGDPAAMDAAIKGADISEFISGRSSTPMCKT